MNFENKIPIHSISVKYFFAVFILGVIVLQFLLEASFRIYGLKILWSSLPGSFALIAFVLGGLLATGMFLTKKTGSRRASFCALSPVSLLLFWPAQETSLSPLIPAGIVLATQIMVFRLLRSDSKPSPAPLGKKRLIFIIAGFFLLFGLVGTAKYYSLGLFDGKDWSVYNQSFWHAQQGRFFTNSTYGSNFACHNSWFFYLLLPFYRLAPHPLTLLLLKPFFFSLSAIPFALIFKNIFGKNPPAAAIVSFLFFPFLVTQNLNAPHEMSYAPFFLLWTFYFYQRRNITLFVLLLFVSLTIKEHLAMLAVAFGLHAFLTKRNRPWILVPLMLGICWGFFSLGFMGYVQHVYRTGTGGSWFIPNLRNRFATGQGDFFHGILHFLAGSNLGRPDCLQTALTPVTALGLIPPLLGGSSVLALPEYLLNLTSDHPALFSAIWHYNVSSSVFLLTGSLEGLRRILGSAWFKKQNRDPDKSLSIALIFQCSLILMHAYLWLPFTDFPARSAYAATVREAADSIPPGAPVTAPMRAMVLFSSRDDFAFLEDRDLKEYVLTDRTLRTKELSSILAEKYRKTFEKNEISVYRKKTGGSAS
jgi:uncharacterized membrane protein